MCSAYDALFVSGDYYITKHSNLAEVHVVFHLATDESVRQANMSSRHQCLSGVRSVLHMASRYDIKNLTVPLLLVYEMSEVSAMCLSSCCACGWIKRVSCCGLELQSLGYVSHLLVMKGNHSQLICGQRILFMEEYSC